MLVGRNDHHTAVASSDNHNSFGGQERLSLNDTAVITAMTITIKVGGTTSALTGTF